MKKSLLTILAVSFSYIVFGQALLSDFDGNGMSGITITKWSPNYTPEVVANPLKEGLNTSNNVISFPANDFYAYYMNLPGFLIFQGVVPATFNNYTYVHFKYLVQDNTAESDTIKIQLKLEKGTEPAIYSLFLTIPVPAGNVNKWEEATMALPRNADNSPITHTQIDFMISANLKPAIPFYLDDITFTSTTTGLNPIAPLSRLNVYQSGNSLNVKLDKEMVVKNLEIYNTSGSLISKYPVGYSTSEISVPAEINSGCYIVKVNTAGKSISKKFIKR
jgi:hypothetical protein